MCVAMSVVFCDIQVGPDSLAKRVFGLKALKAAMDLLLPSVPSSTSMKIWFTVWGALRICYRLDSEHIIIQPFIKIWVWAFESVKKLQLGIKKIVFNVDVSEDYGSLLPVMFCFYVLLHLYYFCNNE